MKPDFTVYFLACSIVLFAAGIGPSVDRADENVLQNPAFDQGERAPTAWVFNSRQTETLIAWDKERVSPVARNRLEKTQVFPETAIYTFSPDEHRQAATNGPLTPNCQPRISLCPSTAYSGRASASSIQLSAPPANWATCSAVSIPR